MLLVLIEPVIEPKGPECHTSTISINVAAIFILVGGRGGKACHKRGPFHKSGSGGCPVGPVRGSSGRNEKLLLL